MIKVGITGQSGFIGSHLYNYLNICNDIETISFVDDLFDDHKLLSKFVEKCDAIVHLAAMNRHKDPQIIYETNIDLTKKLISAIESTNAKPHILFSSSTQENMDNLYGKSKLEGRRLIEEWALNNDSCFSGFVIPNVFGPFGKPNYNSFIATFCHKLVNNQQPEVINDSYVKLIYVQELVEEIYKSIITKENNPEKILHHTSEKKVTEILALLREFKSLYYENHIFPEIKTDFHRNLFNTFRCYFDIKNHYPVNLTKHSDPRGSFVETIKLKLGGQVSFSTTVPGIVRGNHYHTRKIERFAVIKGKALIQLRRIGTDEVLEYYLDGENPSFVDMPIWYTHNIKNIGETELYTIFWINELFNPEDTDTYFEEV